ncbi:hypothetical protein [Paraburkholderia bannensis]|uniref:hypothetical protein n=1 Tax=Paraburkholderia bannensis TaxID=765414 RepID=UPI0005A98AC5|nr:hypothetical protein [Paraburkholderia bannensis]
MHLPQHQEMLRNAAKHGGLPAVMQIIREENPGALHTEVTLSQRRFFHQPARDIPLAGFEKHVDWVKVAEATRLAHRHSSGASAASKSSEATDEIAALA